MNAPVSPCKTGQSPDICQSEGILRPWWQLSGFTRVRGTDRFWRKVKKTVTAGECWPWLNGRNGAGYGVIAWGDKRVYAHRLAYELYHGAPVPEHLVVRHLCGNQLCCRPTHLAVGTPADNSRDMVEQGRHCNTRRLTYAGVQHLRAMHAQRARLVDIAAPAGMIRAMTLKSEWPDLPGDALAQYQTAVRSNAWRNNGHNGRDGKR